MTPTAACAASTDDTSLETTAGPDDVGDAEPARPPAPVRRSAPWREIALLAAVWVAYTVTRLAASNDLTLATDHARDVLRLERWLNLDLEASVNAAISQLTVLEVAASYWYTTTHYVVTVTTLVLLYRRRRDLYVRARTALMVATFAALGCYLVYPTAPPRLVDGYVDTLGATARWGWWSDHASAPRGLGGATNQLAAMPSMHVGWAVWCSVVLVWVAHHNWQRIAAVAYSVVTAVVVVVTANHWLLDAVAGAALVLAALAVTQCFSKRDRPDGRGRGSRRTKDRDVTPRPTATGTAVADLRTTSPAQQ